MAPSVHKRAPRYRWERLSDAKLLDLKLCDLELKIAGSELEAYIQQLFDELRARGLKLMPPCWLSYDWFAPSHIAGIAIPFYLAHPRLKRLEDQMMLEVEGGTKEWCMSLLRHEAGHVYETAYRLGRRPTWRRVFGSSSKPYPRNYRIRPISKNYVLHLDWWYAQSHPSEDFAETFAVWLAPGSRWRAVYRNWPALKKLEYVDRLMTELAGKRPPQPTRERDAHVSALRWTLREHYNHKRRERSEHYPDFYDPDLHELFPDPPDPSRAPAAAAYLRQLAPELRRIVSSWAGVHAYTVDLVLRDMITRCRELDLRVGRSASEIKLEAAIMLTMQTMNFVYHSDYKVPL
jgi:hypothetical protein